MGESSANRLALQKIIGELESSSKLKSQEVEDPSFELPILKAVVSETKKMYQEKEQALFNDASVLLKSVASKLGVKHLAGVCWTSTSLKITVADSDTAYSKLSPGEKLRFRIAASVTIAQLAASTGQGRHPGILFFDSPKSEEITDSDFEEIMAAITQLIKQDGGLQVFVASRVSEGAIEQGHFKDTKLATGVDFLF